MKRKYIVRLSIILLIGFVAFASCKTKSTKKDVVAHEHSQEQEYTCPMHPEVIKDKPGSCPICGMDLVPKTTMANEEAVDSNLMRLLKPVNEQVIATISTIKPDAGTRIFSMPVQGSITYDNRRQTSIASRVSGRIERLLIKYNYQPVRKGQLIMEIYSPDLAAAQRELLYISQTDRNDVMLQRAKQKLQLLGMQPAQIQQVLRTKKVNYRVPVYSNASGYILEKAASAQSSSGAAMPTPTSTSGGDGMGGMSSGGGSSSAAVAPSPTSTINNSPVMIREGQYVNAGESIFTIYNNTSLVAEFAFTPSLAAQIKRGQKLVFHSTADPETVYTGSVGLIQPTFRAGSNFTLARVYLQDSRFQIGQLVTANIPILNRGWWVPQSAVLVLGNKSVVFKKENDVFVPKPVQTKITANGMVLIADSVRNWDLASNASYLVDSESFIRINSNNQSKQ